MSRSRPDEHCLSTEFSALVRLARDGRDAEARLALFRALLDLERRAGLADVSDQLLRQITEARFLAGILRDCVGPVNRLGPRGATRILSGQRWSVAGGEWDLDALNAAQG